jgi:putative acetyltransferase
MIIRPEIPNDFAEIEQVTIAAFAGKRYSDQTEHLVVNGLRDAKELSVSLVAEINGKIVGHIGFSRVTINGEYKNWYGLGPVSVLPEYQRKGIGKALIQEGLALLKNINARGCCLVGHPDYYSKFGFKNVSGLVHEGVPPEVFFALSFDGRIPQGTVAFHEGFKADRPQKAESDNSQRA